MDQILLTHNVLDQHRERIHANQQKGLSGYRSLHAFFLLWDSYLFFKSLPFIQDHINVSQNEYKFLRYMQIEQSITKRLFDW